ncbi:carbohydrate ABC transporter permease [Rhizohabitans arisaemae]|uniref:carbohydrate ABC transporter permease n=1 Tax=Rhizohabitans arisaemae TaxID=2720610 RepID=UPI0024B282C9|nr:carbohydrate ABC transporter permease [Rhizohabitans arisaemae]
MASSSRMGRARRTNVIAGTLLSLFVAVGLGPYVFMVVTSVKTNDQFNESYWVPTWPFHWDNYAAAWRQVSPYLYSSVIVAGLAIVGSVAFSAVAAHVFARYRFAGRNLLFALIAALLMVPPLTSLIPLFVLMRDLGILDSRLVLIVPHVVSGAILGVVLMRTYIARIPGELYEAAGVDGAGGIRMFLSITLPLARPAIGVVSLLTVLNVWNDYFWPFLTVSTDEYRTIPAGLAFFAGQNVTVWGPLFAGYTISSIPLLLLFTFVSRAFLAGIQGGLAVNR